MPSHLYLIRSIHQSNGKIISINSKVSVALLKKKGVIVNFNLKILFILCLVQYWEVKVLNIKKSLKALVLVYFLLDVSFAEISQK